MDSAQLYKIGLTGGIACGKSAVVAMLEELGAWTIDADQVTRQLQQPGYPVYDQIVATFGTEILVHPDGPIDRPSLGARVFNNPEELRQLEAIVHPAVRAEVFAWLDDVATRVPRGTAPDTLSKTKTRPVAVIDAIKLLEGGWQQYCDAVWVVTCAPAQQLERLVQTRGMREAEARQRIAAQPPQESRVAHATVVIDNSGTLEETRQQVTAAWHAMMHGG